MKIYDEAELKYDLGANFGRPYQQCSISVMDTIADPDIAFNGEGVSNYAEEYFRDFEEYVPANAESQLQQLIKTIKAAGKGKKYDCLTGISGGVDSSYLIYKAKEWGLRPLIVHFDNGWNTEIAVKNINNIISKTGFDLYTLVVDWEEFKDLQVSYIKAGVVDLEVPTDHAIYATWYQLAKKFHIKYVLNGNNYVTESIMPPSWTYNKADAINLMNIHDKFGQKKLKTFPLVKPLMQAYYSHFLNLKIVKPLNLINYNKKEAKQKIANHFSWTDYGGKHYESFYTKFYQAYILPVKFSIDKRKAHLSNLILSKDITKERALEILREPLYTPADLQIDKDYFLKKLSLSESFFEEYLLEKQVRHEVYGKQKFVKEMYPVLNIFKPLYKLLRK